MRRLAAEVEEGQQDAIDAGACMAGGITSITSNLHMRMDARLTTTKQRTHIDLALAMLLQEEEEERATAIAARNERERRARQTLGDGGQYSKVQLAFQEMAAAAVPTGGGGGRVLLGEADALGMEAETKEEEEEGGEDDDPLGLGGLTAVGGRRRRRGELLRTAGGEVVTKHDLALNARANALELAMRYQGVGDLEGEARWVVFCGVAEAVACR